MRTIDHRFTNWAPTYGDDALSDLLGRLSRHALLSMQLTESDRFLDVGCGGGAAVRQAALTVRFAVGVDACPAMVERACQLDQQARFVTADAHHLRSATAPSRPSPVAPRRGISAISNVRFGRWRACWPQMAGCVWPTCSSIPPRAGFATPNPWRVQQRRCGRVG
jgi:SAM-dependent methyltransferase